MHRSLSKAANSIRTKSCVGGSSQLRTTASAAVRARSRPARMAGFSTIIRKDLRLEVRRGESTITLIALSLLILVVLVFALDPAGGSRDAATAAGALWVALVFAGMLGATRVLLAERDNGCIFGLLLSPVDPATIYCAK